MTPPFNSNANYAAPIGSEAAGAEFKDTWTLSDLDTEWINLIASKHPALYRVLLAAITDNDKSYLVYMAVRLMEMHRVLKSTGTIYLHCDPTMSHYLKLVMDAVFGRDNFVNEVIWHYKSFHGQTRRYFAKKHDTFLMYSKSDTWTFNRLYEDDNTQTVDFKRWRKYLVDGRYILGRNMPVQDSRFVRYLKAWRKKYGREPGNDDVVYEVKGQSLDTVWDLKPVDPKDKKEKVGYPTQKPLALYQRIIAASSNKGDIVFDPFCGCATTLVAADRLDRQWAGIDVSSTAATLILRRLRHDRGPLYDDVIHLTDIPQRNDLGKLPPANSPANKKLLYGEQAGNCEGCGQHFQVQNLEVDHIIAKSKGGTDHIENLQLLCGSCNRIKGNRGMEYLQVKLQLT